VAEAGMTDILAQHTPAHLVWQSALSDLDDARRRLETAERVYVLARTAEQRAWHDAGQPERPVVVRRTF